MSAAMIMHTMAAVDGPRARKRTEVQFDTDVTVEIYPGVKLKGHISCLVQLEPWTAKIEAIADHELIVEDMNENPCDVDWDDLVRRVPTAEENIELQVMKAFRGELEDA